MAAADPRDARIAELEKLVAEQGAQIEAQASRIEELEALVRELMSRLGRNSRNGHAPPSSDPLGTRPGPGKGRKGKRKRGGQPGHGGAQRVLLDDVDKVIELRPVECDSCGSALRGSDPEPLREQVYELPRIRPHVTEYRQHALECRCGYVTRAALPSHVRGAYGPSLVVALVGYLTGGLRLSKRVVGRMMADLFGVPMADGTVCKVEQRVREALAPAHAEALQAVRAAEVVHADETGWREDKKRAWLWVFATAVVTVFVIARSRGRRVLQDALGEGFSGKLVSDRWAPYAWVDVARRQLCWAHLIRDFRWMLEHGTQFDRVHAEALLDDTSAMFRWWHKLREGAMTRRGFRRCMSSVRSRIEDSLAALAEHGTPRLAGKAREILALRAALWTFVDHDGIDPTNNLAERQVRHAVVWRKCSYGTDSQSGSRFVEAVLTVVLTARQQARNPLHLLTDYVHAHFHATQRPSLVAA